MDMQDLRNSFDRVSADVARDMRRFADEAVLQFAQLSATERMIITCLFVLGLFYLSLRHFTRDPSADASGRHFAGILIVVAVCSVGAGWLLSGRVSLPGL